jgi:hypothetical protein
MVALDAGKILDAAYTLMRSMTGIDYVDRQRTEMWIARLSVSLRERPDDAELRQAVDELLDKWKRDHAWSYRNERDAWRLDEEEDAARKTESGLPASPAG